MEVATGFDSSAPVQYFSGVVMGARVLCKQTEESSILSTSTTGLALDLKDADVKIVGVE